MVLGRGVQPLCLSASVLKTDVYSIPPTEHNKSMIENWRQILWALRVPAEPYYGMPLPIGERCPLLGYGCGASNVCRYDLVTHHGVVDGRCLTKRGALVRMT